MRTKQGRADGLVLVTVVVLALSAVIGFSVYSQNISKPVFLAHDFGPDMQWSFYTSFGWFTGHISQGVTTIENTISPPPTEDYATEQATLQSLFQQIQSGIGNGALVQQYLSYAKPHGVSTTQPWTVFLTVMSDDGKMTLGYYEASYNGDGTASVWQCEAPTGANDGLASTGSLPSCPGTMFSPAYSITATYSALMGFYHDYQSNNLLGAAYDFTTDMGAGTLSYQRLG